MGINIATGCNLCYLIGLIIAAAVSRFGTAGKACSNKDDLHDAPGGLY